MQAHSAVVAPGPRTWELSTWQWLWCLALGIQSSCEAGARSMGAYNVSVIFGLEVVANPQ